VFFFLFFFSQRELEGCATDTVEAVGLIGDRTGAAEAFGPLFCSSEL